jgi:hypothetical protein
MVAEVQKSPWNSLFKNIFLLLHDAFLPYFFLFSEHWAILELGYLKSGKSLIRSWSGPGHSG